MPVAVVPAYAQAPFGVVGCTSLRQHLEGIAEPVWVLVVSQQPKAVGIHSVAADRTVERRWRSDLTPNEQVVEIVLRTSLGQRICEIPALRPSVRHLNKAHREGPGHMREARHVS